MQDAHQIKNLTSEYAHKVTREKNIEVNYSFPQSDNLWYVEDAKLKPMDSVMGYTESSIGQAFKRAFLFSFVNKYAILINGTTAFTTIKGNNLVFYTRMEPGNIGIARLTVQQQRNRRFIWNINRIGSSMAHFYPPKDSIAYKWAKTQKGVYQITIADEMTNGEYAIITTSIYGIKAYCFRFERD